MFYTDEPSKAIEAHHWHGDRIDLDILASQVQPLTHEGRGRPQDDVEEDYDDSKLAEEAERRQIDAKKGKATGEERNQTPAMSNETLERATKRLARRLDRAATSIEKSLKDRENLETIPPQSIARQIWMTHIGAFLAGRQITSDEGDEYECLDAWSFADHVLRVCRALTGSKRGGFLDKIPTSIWDGYDGELLQKGLSFLWTCVTWAAAYMVS